MNDDVEEARIILDKIYSREHEVTATEIKALQQFIQTADLVVVEPASRALAELARNTPERIEESSSVIGDLLDHDDPQIRANALRALAGIAHHSPSTAEPFLAAFVENLTASYLLLQRAAIEGLQGISNEYPEAVASNVNQLQNILSDTNGPYLEKPILEVLSNIAETNPEKIAPLASDLLQLGRRTDNQAIRNRIVELLSTLVEKGEIDEEFEQHIRSLRR